MNRASDYSWPYAVRELLVRAAISGLVPARRGAQPDPATLPARTGHLNLEIVTHCWQYASLLTYQLASLASHPPAKLSVVMTVFHTPEDRATAALLEEFGARQVPGVTWNWQALPKPELFRRSIGRNRAALATKADWVWFADCDVFFGEGCLDGLADVLQGRSDVLLFPRRERCTPLLAPNDPILAPGAGRMALDFSRFETRVNEVAKGGFQITHGDVARAHGYCAALDVYQRPARRWQKARDDRAFRWLLGTDGVPIDLPAVYRIRHAAKGRYGTPVLATIRSWARRLGAWMESRSASR